ncbi:WEB family protein [Apostasia shenzhenica]|uniref:WEB family protein n=1 Tax=Apostasia shenzhenica TaxID=1088818 RepID=A0A2H9ZWP9_9ASPA|nr:WEB family protein [Apostasia shenzhenica]
MEKGSKGRHGRALVAGRAEIDTSSPFRSVKEAVVLFGEKVLAGEIVNKLNQMRATASRPNKQKNPILHYSLESELEEAKQILSREREEKREIFNCLLSLKQELQRTKQELEQLKAKEIEKKPAADAETEHIKFIEKASTDPPVDEGDGARHLSSQDWQRKNYMKFSNPPLLARALSMDHQSFDRQDSMNREEGKKEKKKKKGQLFSRMASMFSGKSRRNI